MIVKNIFICYRRDDAEGYAGRIFDRLNMRFPNRIFMDVTGISPGADFTRVIQERVGACHALIAIIGKSWLMMADEASRRRLFRDDDYVRHEIGTALKRNITVIPVLVRDAKMPPVESLPPDLAALSYRNAIEVTDADFDHDVGRLIKGLEFAFGEQPPPSPPPARASKSSCLPWSILGLVLGGLGLFLLFVMVVIYYSQRDTNNVGSGPTPVYSNAPTAEPSLTPAPVDDDFEPVGTWIIQIEGFGQGSYVLNENYTYQSTAEQGTWEYAPDDRALTLNGFAYDLNGTMQQVNAQIIIEGRSGNQFVGHVYIGGIVRRVGLTKQ